MGFGVFGLRAAFIKGGEWAMNQKRIAALNDGASPSRKLADHVWFDWTCFCIGKIEDEMKESTCGRVERRPLPRESP